LQPPFKVSLKALTSLVRTTPLLKLATKLLRPLKLKFLTVSVVKQFSIFAVGVAGTSLATLAFQHISTTQNLLGGKKLCFAKLIFSVY
jgi:hypothetical protein